MAPPPTPPPPPMDPEFKRRTEDLIVQTLELYRSAEASPRVAEVWGCGSTGDFMCGFFVGEIIGSALNAFQAFHGREPTPGEHLEIVGMVEAHAGEIRGFFSRI